jgi:hypothetical protein
MQRVWNPGNPRSIGVTMNSQSSKTDAGSETCIYCENFRRVSNSDVRSIQLFQPRALVQPDGGVYWRCRFTVFDGKQECQGEAAGDNWLQAFMLALQKATIDIAHDQTDWVNSHDVEAWAILPKLVPISWGFEFFKQICDYIEDQEDEKNRFLAAKFGNQ